MLWFMLCLLGCLMEITACGLFSEAAHELEPSGVVEVEPRWLGSVEQGSQEDLWRPSSRRSERRWVCRCGREWKGFLREGGRALRREGMRAGKEERCGRKGGAAVSRLIGTGRCSHEAGTNGTRDVCPARPGGVVSGQEEGLLRLPALALGVKGKKALSRLGESGMQ